jgi:hypothetical protein
MDTFCNRHLHQHTVATGCQFCGLESRIIDLEKDNSISHLKSLESRIEKLEGKKVEEKERYNTELESLIQHVKFTKDTYGIIDPRPLAHEVRELVKKEIKKSFHYSCTVAEAKWIDIIKEQVEEVIDKL